MEDILILNALAELQSLSESVSHVRHCTDVVSVASSSAAVWGHNEDGSVGDRNTCYFVNLSYSPLPNETKRGASLERFMAFSYAGAVGGLAYGWNRHGVVLSVNSLFPRVLNMRCPMSQAVGRAALAAHSVDDALLTVLRGRGASGFNINIGSVAAPQRVSNRADAFFPLSVLSAEVDGSTKAASVHETTFHEGKEQSMYLHANMYKLLHADQDFDPSSEARLAALSRYLQPLTTDEIARMLGDTTNESFPVYNANGTAKDPVQTLTTVTFDLAQRLVRIYDRNPAAFPPAMEWSLVLP
jgi:hypothetical protein